jgi:hypothetical protein
LNNSSNDGFGHETDYGYTYVTNDDRPDLPLEWDDRMNEQWKQTTGNLKYAFLCSKI